MTKGCRRAAFFCNTMEFTEEVLKHFGHLKEFARQTWDESALARLDEAFGFAQSVIGRSQFKTGEYILKHSVEVATVIAVEIGLEPDTVITGMLQNIMYAGLEKKVTREELEELR